MTDPITVRQAEPFPGHPIPRPRYTVQARIDGTWSNPTGKGADHGWQAADEPAADALCELAVTEYGHARSDVRIVDAAQTPLARDSQYLRFEQALIFCLGASTGQIEARRAFQAGARRDRPRRDFENTTEELAWLGLFFLGDHRARSFETGDSNG